MLQQHHFTLFCSPCPSGIESMLATPELESDETDISSLCRSLKSQNTGHMFPYSLSLLWEKPQVGCLFPIILNCDNIWLWYYRPSGAKTICLCSFLFIAAPRHPSYASLINNSESDETQIIILDRLLKRQNVKHTFQSSLFSAREKLQVRLNCTSLGVGQIQGKRKYSFSYQCDNSKLVTGLWYYNFLTGFWSYHTSVLAYILSLSVSVGEQELGLPNLTFCWCCSSHSIYS